MNEKSHNVIISVRKRPLSLVEKTKEHYISLENEFSKNYRNCQRAVFCRKFWRGFMKQMSTGGGFPGMPGMGGFPGMGAPGEEPFGRTPSPDPQHQIPGAQRGRVREAGGGDQEVQGPVR